MPANKNSLIRYRTLDKCLRNRQRRWTLEDLIDAVSEALYEFEGIDKGVSRRTVQLDIQMMRSDKLGYNAPIVVENRKYYTYADPEYSIEKIPLTEGELEMLGEAVGILQQFHGFSHFQEMEGMVKRLEDKVRMSRSGARKVIDFEKNEDLKGLEFLDELYKATLNQHPVTITYQSFRAKAPRTFGFLPLMLKEFRNRWFLVGKEGQEKPVLNLALDRMIEVAVRTEEVFGYPPDFDPDTWFQHAIGVTVQEGLQPETVRLQFSRYQARYVLTKPMHPTQKVVAEDEKTVTIELTVVLNFELERDIISFGEHVKVLAPEQLKSFVSKRLRAAVESYDQMSEQP